MFVEQPEGGKKDDVTRKIKLNFIQFCFSTSNKNSRRESHSAGRLELFDLDGVKEGKSE